MVNPHRVVRVPPGVAVHQTRAITGIAARTSFVPPVPLLFATSRAVPPRNAGAAQMIVRTTRSEARLKRRHSGLKRDATFMALAADCRARKRSVAMKIMPIPLIAACVLVVGAGMPHRLHANEMSASVRPPPHQKMEDDANASAQAATDMSYGGTSDTHSESGSRTNRSCGPRGQCDIYFGQ